MRSIPNCGKWFDPAGSARGGRPPGHPVGGGAPHPFRHRGRHFLQGRVALGPRAGQLLRRLRSAAAAAPTGPRCARLEGFSLHADVAVRAPRRDQLEHLCRSLVRPPLVLDRLTETTGGQLLYQRRRPWRDASTALLLDPLELLERLAALVPAPRRPLLAIPRRPGPARGSDIVHPFVKYLESRGCVHHQCDSLGDACDPAPPLRRCGWRQCRAPTDRAAMGHTAPPAWPGECLA